MKDIIKRIVKQYSQEGGIKKKKLIKLVLADFEGGDSSAVEEALEKLISKEKLTVDHENIINLAQESKSSSKKRKISEVEAQDREGQAPQPLPSAVKSPVFEELWKNGEKLYREGAFTFEYNKSNPDNITRLFCGNLNKNVTEEQLKQCIEGITYIKWITDKTTKAFYGSTFLEMKDPQAAITAVLQDGTKFLGRPLKIYYCPPKPGDVWPPLKSSGSGESGASKFNKEKTPKPPNGKKLFIGNLSYDIDDNSIIEFFKDCGELVGLRWLVRQDTGDFRGAGYVEFATSEEADEAFKLDGTQILGRPIRIDWTE